MKLAIFVEGLTERLLVQRLINEIAHRGNVRVDVVEALGKTNNRQIRLISKDIDTGQPGYVLIRDCHNDVSVTSDVRDQYESLSRAGYDGIIGIRDLFPKSLSDLSDLQGTTRRSVNFGLPTKPIKVAWIIAIMETEAWFLAEHTHFERIHPNLTCDRIFNDLGFNPETEDMELRPHPANDLHQIYSLENLAYSKTNSRIARTINVLDIAEMYLGMSNVKQLNALIRTLDYYISMVAARA